MRPVFVLCFVLMFYVHDGQGTIGDFFDQIGHALSVTWTSVVDAIKRPVRLKKIGPGSKRKALRLMTTHMPYIWSSPKDSEMFLNDISRKSAADITVSLPLLLHPKYKSLQTWLNKQTEEIPTTSKDSPTYSSQGITTDVTDDGEKINNDESNIFGPLIFI